MGYVAQRAGRAATPSCHRPFVFAAVALAMTMGFEDASLGAESSERAFAATPEAWLALGAEQGEVELRRGPSADWPNATIVGRMDGATYALFLNDCTPRCEMARAIISFGLLDLSEADLNQLNLAAIRNGRAFRRDDGLTVWEFALLTAPPVSPLAAELLFEVIRDADVDLAQGLARLQSPSVAKKPFR